MLLHTYFCTGVFTGQISGTAIKFSGKWENRVLKIKGILRGPLHLPHLEMKKCTNFNVKKCMLKFEHF